MTVLLRRRRGARAGSHLVVALLSAGSVFAPASALGAPCKPYEAIGIRGSGESLHIHGRRNLGKFDQAVLDGLFGFGNGPGQPMGTPNFYQSVALKFGRPTVDDNRHVVSTTKMDVTAVPYPATAWPWALIGFGGPYVTSYQEGSLLFIQMVRRRLRTCPKTKFLILGYSQGAHVFHDAAPHLAEYASSFAAVVLFADPTFRPQSITAAGPEGFPAGLPNSDPGRLFALKRHGVLGSGPEYPRQFRDRVLSWCRGGDRVCQGLSVAPNFKQHDAYANIVDQSSAITWIYQRALFRRGPGGTGTITITSYDTHRGATTPTPLPGVQVGVRHRFRYLFCDAPARATDQNGVALFSNCPILGPGEWQLTPQIICPVGYRPDGVSAPTGGTPTLPNEISGLGPGKTLNVSVFCAPSD